MQSPVKTPNVLEDPAGHILAAVQRCAERLNFSDSRYAYVALLESGPKGLEPVLLKPGEKVTGFKPAAAFRITFLDQKTFVLADGKCTKACALLTSVRPETVMEGYCLEDGEEISEYNCPVCGFPFTSGVLEPGGDYDEWKVLPHCSNSRCRMEARWTTDPYLDCEKGVILERMSPLTVQAAAWAFGLLSDFVGRSSSWRVPLAGINISEDVHLDKEGEKLPFGSVFSRLLEWGWVPREDGLWVKAPDPVSASKSWYWEELNVCEEPVGGEFLRAGSILLESVKERCEVPPSALPAAREGKVLVREYGLSVLDSICLKGRLRTIVYPLLSADDGIEGTLSLPYTYEVLRPDGKPICCWRGVGKTVRVRGVGQRWDGTTGFSPPEALVQGPNITFWGPDGSIQGEIYLQGQWLSHCDGGPTLWIRHGGETLLSVYTKHGELHREDGPAVREVCSDNLLSTREVYAIDGQKMSKEEWRREVALRRLSNSIRKNRKLSL